jgi:hypothetical protein
VVVVVVAIHMLIFAESPEVVEEAQAQEFNQYFQRLV